MIQLEHWAPTPIVSRRDRHAAEVWNPHMVNRFPPKKPNEGSVVQAPWARCRDNVIHRRATRLGAVGARRVDPTYLPAHTVCAFSETELDALRAIGGSLAHGLVKKRDVKRLMAACFPNENVAAAKARHCGRDLHVSKHRHGTFPGVCAWIATSRLSVNRAAKHPHNNLKIPLPPCCANPACRICVMSLSPQQLNDMSPEVRQMYTMWRSLVDHGGEGVTFNGVEECLAKHGVPLPTDEVAEVFERYDADGSNHLDFDEFMGLLDDLRVGDKIVRKRVTAYSLPPEIAKDYTDEEVAQLAHSFGLYDDSGDGVMDMKELEAAMVSLGHSLEEHELKFMLSMIDTDRSFTVDFGEFAQLLKRMVDGRLQVDASLMHRSFVGSIGVERLKAEVDAMHHGGPDGSSDLPPGVAEITLHATKPDPTVQATFLGEALLGTPYEGFILRLQVQASPRYPLDAPRVAFSRRVVHANFDIAMAGNTQLPQLMATWDAAKDLRWLYGRIYELLRNPEPNLVPPEKRPEAALADSELDEDGTSQPPGYDMRTKRNSDRFAAELGLLFREKPRVYFAVARRNAKKYLEPDPHASRPTRLNTPDGTAAPLRRARGVGTMVASRLQSTAKHMLFDGLKDFEQFAEGDEADEFGGEESSW
ncbi:hypothetical protein SO694_00006557 [Aureococcus anophagefferens]|uniref:Calmodulin n=1 Tax=Aureococcus anophagefferens TaxID=44056 RepID=A0ABR1GAL2_AURAN